MADKSKLVDALINYVEMPGRQLNAFFGAKPKASPLAAAKALKQMGGDVLGSIQSAYTAPGRAYQGEFAPKTYMDENGNIITDDSKAMQEANNLALNFMGSSSLPALNNPMQHGALGITAWHGSPKELIGNKFDLSRAGTGGGSDFGHGAYLSESPSVASKYMGDEEKFITTVNGNVVDTPVMQSIIRMGKNPNEYIKVLDKKLFEQNKTLASASKDEILPGLSDYDIAKLEYNSILNKINEAKSYIGKDIQHQRAGNLYKADISDETLPYFINWESSKQTPEVVSILKNAGIYQPNKTGQDLYFNAIEKAGSSDAQKSGFQKASEYLNSLGVKGNTYTDRTYGTVAKNPTNYVVFDPNIVKLLQRNGIDLP